MIKTPFRLVAVSAYLIAVATVVGLEPTAHAASSVEVQITGQAGIPSTASAVAINLTATNASQPGWAVAYPCGSPLPTSSTINYSPNQGSIANSAIVEIGSNGRICLYALNDVDLIVDVQGWFPANATYTALNPQRLLDTRTTGNSPNNTTIQTQITGQAGIPSTASAVAINLTATNASQPGWAVAYPCGSPLPTSSTINYSPNQGSIANSAIVEIGSNGRICLYALNDVDLIVDVQGWFPANATYTALNPQRLLDTRTGLGVIAPAPPANAAFAEFFTGNTGLSNFDTGVYHRDDVLVAQTQWTGDHDMNCGDPTTQRMIHRNAPAETFYLCRDHLMTSVGDTSGYSIAWFSPKQTFQGGSQTRVSWEVSVTDLGARQWWEVSIVPVGSPFLATVDWVANTAQIATYDSRSVVVGTGPYGNDGNIVTEGISRDPLGFGHVCGSGAADPEACASKAIRRPFSITDNRNGTITFEYLGSAYTYTGSFPSQFKVYFKDHNYTPDKDGVPVGHTWHWDSIVVS